MATSYTSNKKIGALDAASTPLAATNEVVINQNGDILKTPLSAIEAKVFDAKTASSSPTGTEVVVVRQTDNTLRQVALADIVPALNITNAKVSASAAIVDTKLDTINTAGKVTNQAVQAVATNTANRIVTRDGSGNFAAGTVTASLSGNASTATTLQTGRTVAISGDVTGTATSFNGSANITIPAVITAGVIVDADINASAAIALSKLATGALPTGITVASANLVDGTIVNADINASAAIVDTKLATIATAGKVANTATTATNANFGYAIVARDESGNFTAGTITAALTGNASTATTLATGRTIALTGDVTYTSPSFNGSANVTAASTIANNAVTTAKILDANVTAAKIADANVTTAKILDANVTTAKIADSAVTSAKIADGTIVNADINASAAIALSKLATGALPTAITIASANIVDGTIVAGDIASNAVTTAKILDANVTNAKLASDIDASKLTTGTLPIARVADAAVTAPKLQNGVTLQTVYAQTTSLIEVDGVIPADNTKPQNTEGDEVLTATITPSSATSKILVQALLTGTLGNAAGTITVALFKDSAASALAASWVSGSSGFALTIPFAYQDAPNTTSAVTYKIRLGYPGNGSGLYLNRGGLGAAIYNGSMTSSMTLTEIKA